MKSTANMKTYINNLSAFLARRDTLELSADELMENYRIPCVDVCILLGNSILDTVQLVVKAYQQNLCRKILISGGIGHSTKFLYENIKNNSQYKNIDILGKSEADIFYEILTVHYNIPASDILVENKSTNCGDNALKTTKLLIKYQLPHDSILLIQDPTMQLRSCASFGKYLGSESRIINFAPFIPTVDENLELLNLDVVGLWKKERFYELLMGEIPRLRDDCNGYGPNGKNYISHVDIPNDIENSYRELNKFFKEKKNYLLSR